MTSLVAMMGCRSLDQDWLDALEAYVNADKARERARQAFERADEVAQQREAELRAVYERLTGEGKADGR